MTREEAIKELEEMIKYEWGTYQTKTARIYVNALDMAIKALEQAPTTQELQAESDKFDAAFQDGYNNGYAQARFDYEQEAITKDDLPKYCDRNICLKNEYNNVGCEDCEVTKSQEPTTKNDLGVDAVSRQAVLDIAKTSKSNWIDNSILFKRVNALPSVTPQEPRWISVSERLPEDSGEYLVSVIDKYDGNYEAVGVAWFAHKKDYDIKESEWRELGIGEIVIAWMPLPKPYREVVKQ